MSALAEKLKKAGADTVGAQLIAACTQEIQQGMRDPATVWRRVGALFGQQLVSIIMADMGLASTVSQPTSAPHPPVVLSPERLENRRKLREVVRSKYKTSAGVSWSDVGWHELPALQRDGKEAAALLARGPANVPNDGRTVGQVLGIAQVNKIVEGVRSNGADADRC